MPFTENENSTRILVIVDTLNNYTKGIGTTEYQHGCLTIYCVSKARLFGRQSVHMAVNLVEYVNVLNFIRP